MVIKIMIKQRENRKQVEIFSIEEFVPSDHLLRKIDRAIDFTHIYDFVEDLYCADNGRPNIDPLVIFINAGKNINYLTFKKNLHTFLDKAGEHPTLPTFLPLFISFFQFFRQADSTVRLFYRAVFVDKEKQICYTLIVLITIIQISHPSK